MNLVATSGAFGSGHIGGFIGAGHRAASRRRETLWAWLSLLVLVICWDAAARLDERISPPRARLTHVAEAEERSAQNALIPVSARPTVN